MTDLTSLLQRAQEATGADRELDAAIYVAVCCVPNDGRSANNGWTFRTEFAPYLIAHPVDGWHPTVPDDAPPLSASVDAALALIGEKLPGWTRELSEQWDSDTDTAARCWIASIWSDHRTSGPGSAGATAPTPALALIVSLLKALEAEHGR